MEIYSLRETPALLTEMTAYLQAKWGSDETIAVYKDCLIHAQTPEPTLPLWYVLKDGERIVGCAGLVTNDFISRMDLFPWLCALYIEEDQRGHGYSQLLIDRIKADTLALGFHTLYLCTDLDNFYERYEFSYLADGYHPWGEQTRIYHWHD